MQPGATPARLNVARACTDDARIAWAAGRLAHDAALAVVHTPAEGERMRHALELERLDFEAAAAAVAVVTASAQRFQKMARGRYLRVRKAQPWPRAGSARVTAGMRSSAAAAMAIVSARVSAGEGGGAAHVSSQPAAVWLPSLTHCHVAVSQRYPGAYASTLARGGP